MEGVTIKLWKGAVLVATTATAADGSYGFSGLVPGDYTVEEVLPDGSYAVTPVTVGLTLTSGDAETADFLNAPIHCSIAGTKWNDADADGIADEGELGLAGVTIQLWAGDEMLDETVTGVDGSYLFEDLEPGDYTVVEVVPEGSYATSPESIDVSLDPDEDLTGVDFLNARYGSIAGTKWDDPNGDGVHQPDEVGVPNVTITLSQEGTVIATVKTSANGTYSFGDLEAGTYDVTETLPSGSTNTTPIKVTVVVAAGQAVTGVDFLNLTVAGEIITPPVTPTPTAETTTGGAQLPLTGFDLLPWILAAGLLMMLGLLSLALGLARSRR